MISKRIWCSRCGHEGPRETAEMGTSPSKATLFVSEGHDPASGKLYFRCPRCKVFITIDPAADGGSSPLRGGRSPLITEAA